MLIHCLRPPPSNTSTPAYSSRSHVALRRAIPTKLKPSNCVFTARKRRPIRASINEVSTPEEAWYEFFPEDYRVGSQSGLASQNSVTFRPELKYFRWEQRWHVIPPKYELLPESEVNRRMKIKLRNRGKVPWNLGQKHSPEWIANIRSNTAKAMQRNDVRQNYEKRMRVCLAMHRATNNKIKAKKEEAKARELKRLGKSLDPEDVEKRKEQRNERRRMRRRELAAERKKEGVEKPKKPRPGPGSRKPLSAEQRRKISESVRKKWSDPNYRYRVTESMRLKRAEANGAYVKKERTNQNYQTLNECRQKYDELMDTIARLIVETDSLEIQKCLVQTDTEVNVEIDNAVDVAKEAIARIKNTVVKVEEELDIAPNTNVQEQNV